MQKFTAPLRRAAGVLVSAWLLAGAAAAVPLPELNIDPAQVSVSGVSSGGYMAVQLHVAYSATFTKGAGVVAGGPYYCAEGSVVYATGRCMAHDTSIPISSLVTTTNNWAASGAIDPVANLAASRLYLFSGTLDSVVKTAVIDDLRSYYGAFVPAANIAYKKDLAAEHAFVTDDYGSACSVKGDPYIDDCNFDLAGALLQQIYGPLNARNVGTLGGSFVEFDQRGFVGGHAMAQTGWAYVPAACASGSATCRLHVALHGCKQNTAQIGQQYVRNTGYNRWADTNNIVVLYPQTGVTATNGCWDWWGYDSPDYAKKAGPQMAAIQAMVKHLSGGTATAALAAPGGLTASAATASTMKLGWSAVPGAAGYVVYRNGGRRNATPLTGTSYTDSDLVAGSSYGWTVRAVNAAGARGAASATATASTTGMTPVCTTTDNYSHTMAARAYALYGFTYAYGSNQAMGLWNIYIETTLKKTAAGYYEVGTCY
ncbi:PHB depolymerase family esterase [uncultured Pseudacidovorax sp.]|uniref:extracellular catalytic domain type 2 short-chain-length polyhydroxyalkanoate depolymerase n=1 Tax=uncultured Pseudacidovorax sp. TaxID=679313 RepID=UPI0025EFD962|nr:PHB depolymerase family esterase [uncultured Pseudacidovorax sp.]